MRIKKSSLLAGFFLPAICLFAAASAHGKVTCSPGSEVTAPAGGSVAAATFLTVYNSAEIGPNGSSARSTADTYDDIWRSAVMSANIGNVFNMVSDISSAQATVNVAQTNAFSISGVSITYDYRDFPLDYRTTARPCDGNMIATPAERVAVKSKDNRMQTVQDAPRPASLYNPSNQPIVYDEIEASDQPNRINTANAVVFTFSTPVKAFGAWFGDVETRTSGDGNPAIVRFLNASGNRIGSDVKIQPKTGSQSGCGGTNPGCGNQSTRWIGFTDTNASERVKHMVVIVGSQGGDACWGDQRISFAGPTIPAVVLASNVSVGGQVMSASGTGLRNVYVTLQNAEGTEARTALTNAFGYYSFHDVPVGASYLISVSSKRHTFSPNSHVITVMDELNNVNFFEELP